MDFVRNIELGGGILQKRYRSVASGLLLAIVVVNSWKICGGGWMSRDSEEMFAKAEAYASCNCLYIYDASWKALPSFLEASHYSSCTFYDANNIESIVDMQYLSDHEMIVFVTNSCDSQAILEYLIEVCPALDLYQELNSYGYATSYYLYADKISDNVQ